MGMLLPGQEFPWVAALLMLLTIFVGAQGEEQGWSSYVIDPLQDRWNALEASLVLGGVGVAWHIVPLAVGPPAPPTWIDWWCLYAVAAWIRIVWLYTNMGKSVFAAALLHATLNLTFMLFPVYGSHFDTRLGSLVMALARQRSPWYGADDPGSVQECLMKPLPPASPS